MKWKQIDGKYLVRVQRGEEIMETLTTFLEEQGIRSCSISGIGAADAVSLSYFSKEDKGYRTKDFTGEFEIASILGNAAQRNGKIWPHLHIVLADTDYRAFGGHLESATISATGELIIDPLSEEVTRAPDEETGLRLWSF